MSERCRRCGNYIAKGPFDMVAKDPAFECFCPEPLREVVYDL